MVSFVAALFYVRCVFEDKGEITRRTCNENGLSLVYFIHTNTYNDCSAYKN